MLNIKIAYKVYNFSQLYCRGKSPGESDRNSIEHYLGNIEFNIHMHYDVQVYTCRTADDNDNVCFRKYCSTVKI